MNDNNRPNDELLQFVFGELDDARKVAVEKSVAGDAELAAVAKGLATAAAAVRAENPGQISDDFNDRLRQRMAESLDSPQTETLRPMYVTHSLDTWRWIMRSPVSRVAAAVIFVVAIGSVAVWLNGGGANCALADFVKPILEAKTAKFTMKYEAEGQPAMTFRVAFLAPNRMRQDLPNGVVNITDFEKGKIVSVAPKEKRATIISLTNMPKDKTPPNYFAQLQSQLLDSEKKPDVKREPLGEKEIGGRRVVGFRISSPAQVLTLWGDPKTGMPVRIETDVNVLPRTKTTWTDFEFNMAVDESQFSLEPPAGYTVVDMPVDASPPTENDLIASLRQYSDVNGGTLPDGIDHPSTMSFVMQTAIKLGVEQGKEPTPKQQKEMMGAIMKLSRGFMFAMQQPTDADAHYAGKGVKLGTADKPVFWYRPKDSKKYRVIYGDLSMREADAAPNAAGAQALPDVGKANK
jgi:outer membrane lipoprotein-sorting protein